MDSVAGDDIVGLSDAEDALRADAADVGAVGALAVDAAAGAGTAEDVAGSTVAEVTPVDTAADDEGQDAVEMQQPPEQQVRCSLLHCCCCCCCIVLKPVSHSVTCFTVVLHKFKQCVLAIGTISLLDRGI